MKNIFNLIKISQQEENKVYSVSISKFRDILEKVEKLNKRATRLNLPPIEIKEIERRVETRKKPDRTLDPTGELREYRDYDIEIVYFTITGVAPKINGWRLVGRIMHVDEGIKLAVNIIKAVPGETIPEKYREAAPTCEHCNSNRNRNDTFILQNAETGKYKQVGRNCLTDFLRSSNISDNINLVDEEGSLIQFIEANEEDDYGFGGARFTPMVNIEKFVVYTMSASRLFGWVSKSKARIDNSRPTVDIIWNALFGKSKYDLENNQAIRDNIRPDDKETAKKAIKWARELKNTSAVNTENSGSDFLWNLSAACSNEVVLYSTSSIVAALPMAYNRNVIEPELNKKKSENQKIDYKIGDKIEKELTIIKNKPIQSQYGISVLHTMIDENGLLYKWFASNEDIPVGTKIKIKGSIKDIGPDKYEKNQNVITLTRCKVLGIVISKEEKEKMISEEEYINAINEIKKYIPIFDVKDSENIDLSEWIVYDIDKDIPRTSLGISASSLFNGMTGYEDKLFNAVIHPEKYIEMLKKDKNSNQAQAIRLMETQDQSEATKIQMKRALEFFDLYSKLINYFIEKHEIYNKLKPLYDKIKEYRKNSHKYNNRNIIESKIKLFSLEKLASGDISDEDLYNIAIMFLAAYKNVPPKLVAMMDRLANDIKIKIYNIFMLLMKKQIAKYLSRQDRFLPEKIDLLEKYQNASAKDLSRMFGEATTRSLRHRQSSPKDVYNTKWKKIALAVARLRDSKGYREISHGLLGYNKKSGGLLTLVHNTDTPVADKLPNGYHILQILDEIDTISPKILLEKTDLGLLLKDFLE